MTTQYKYLDIEDKKMLAKDKIMILESAIYQYSLDKEAANSEKLIELNQAIEEKSLAITAIYSILENLNAGIDNLTEY